MEILIDARPDQVVVIRQAAAAAAQAAGFEPDRVEDVRLAVGEASANAVIHATPDARASVAILIFQAEDALEFVVRDWGPGIRPRPDSPGLGLGLPLIAALADAVEFGSASPGANDVSMTFRRRPRGLGGDVSDGG